MKRVEKMIKVVTFRSEVRPEIETDVVRYAEVIAWADKNPVAWDVVMGTKSVAFGRNACNTPTSSKPSQNP